MIEMYLKRLKEDTKARADFTNRQWEVVKHAIDMAASLVLNECRVNRIQLKPVMKLKDGKIVEIYTSIKEAAKKNNIARTTIDNYLAKQRTPKNGITYEFVNKEKGPGKNLEKPRPNPTY